MFPKLNKKYTRLLLGAVSIVFISYSFVIFFSYCNLLKNDYSDKISYFSDQQVENARKALYFTEFNIKMFSSKVDLTPTGTLGSYEIYPELRRVHSLSLDISSFFLITSGVSYTTSGKDYRLSSALLERYPQLFESPDEDIRWYYLHYEDSSRDELLCMKSIPYPSGNASYTLCITIPTDTVLPVPAALPEDSSIFSDRNFSFSLLPDEDAVLWMEDSAQNSPLPSITPADDSDLFSERIGSSPFTLCIQITQAPLQRMLLLFFAGILILCSALFAAAFLTLKHFLRKLDTALTSLSGQFSCFLDTLEP